ncbi:MAG: restriction endonuclease [Chloroflexi bacterium]|nr:restriction endonuclease [Chloroflexota bacterium]
MAKREAWVVRAGEEIQDKVEKASVLAIGWRKMGDLKELKEREEFRERHESIYGETGARSAMGAGQLYRFVREMRKGDLVVSPLRASLEVLIGEVTGDYTHNPGQVSTDYPNIRPVKWSKKVSRDDLSAGLRRSLGGLATVFQVSDHLSEVEGLLTKQPGNGPPPPDTPAPYHEEVEATADDMISDVLMNRIGPYEFQQLVAGLLRAMGFRTRVSAPGADGGVDIRAFPDALGFQSPRIRVQVKHRKGSAGAPEVQQLAGATKGENYNGLFVSTGDFTNQAKTEADRHTHITLMDRDEFVRLLLEHYEKLEPEYQALIPLRKVYIPTRSG